MAHFCVSLSPADAANVLYNYVINEGISTECVGRYANRSPNGQETILLVFEKYFMRNSSRASLSVIIENVSGQTIVYSIGSGGGQSTLWKFDWGASSDFANLVPNALRNYITNMYS